MADNNSSLLSPSVFAGQYTLQSVLSDSKKCLHDGNNMIISIDELDGEERKTLTNITVREISSSSISNAAIVIMR